MVNLKKVIPLISQSKAKPTSPHLRAVARFRVIARFPSSQSVSRLSNLTNLYAVFIHLASTLIILQ